MHHSHSTSGSFCFSFALSASWLAVPLLQPLSVVAELPESVGHARADAAVFRALEVEALEAGTTLIGEMFAQPPQPTPFWHN